jgi:hypothetical protein
MGIGGVLDASGREVAEAVLVLVDLPVAPGEFY